MIMNPLKGVDSCYILGTKYFPSASEKDSNTKPPTTNISPCFKEDAEPLRSNMSPRHNKSGTVDRASAVAVRLNANSANLSAVI